MNEKPRFSWKDIIIALIIPFELLMGEVINKLAITNNPILGSVVTLLIFFSGFLVAVLFRKDVLKADFRMYKKHFFKNFGISLLGALLFGLIVMGGRYLLDQSQAASSLSVDYAAVGWNNVAVLAVPLLVSGMIPLMAAFTEEIIFRYTFFYKWSNNKGLRFLMWGVSSILFGLAHYNNYSTTPLYMIPLMIAGFMLAGLYYWKKNIWIPIFAHFIYNGALSTIPAIFVLVVQLMQGT
ncbi:type II CAAX endopeptidase family protein [Enterococcus sp.]|uniref:CPBP family intramembrane glutamic endopeptidase n=1 Tax=Enterococcus sp. TaxID=35783 RepID=UPI00290D51F5|nr:type II CAAX endopeptidase family protein [Enterococcus sp.]MDU5336706.1 type II CAAX endopeptidase family protein [Enterococcus sp.]